MAAIEIHENPFLMKTELIIKLELWFWLLMPLILGKGLILIYFQLSNIRWPSWNSKWSMIKLQFLFLFYNFGIPFSVWIIFLYKMNQLWNYIVLYIWITVTRQPIRWHVLMLRSMVFFCVCLWKAWSCFLTTYYYGNTYVSGPYTHVFK